MPSTRPFHLIIVCAHIAVFSLYTDALVSVTTVQQGDPVTFTCVFPERWSRRQLNWYKQSAGENLKRIVALREHTSPVYESGISASRLEVKESKLVSNLTILRTMPEDEGMYHCAMMDLSDISWSATYLAIEGKVRRINAIIKVRAYSLNGLLRLWTEYIISMTLTHVYFTQGKLRGHPTTLLSSCRLNLNQCIQGTR